MPFALSFVEMDLFGDHALALHQGFAVLFFTDLQYLFNGLFAVLGPDYFAARVW